MGWFSRKPAGSADQQKAPPQPHCQANRDYAWAKTEDQIAVKLWIPERLDQVLNDVALDLHLSVSAVVRRSLFIQLYGRNDFLVVGAQRGEWLHPGDVRYSRDAMTPAMTKRHAQRGRRGGRMPQLGKNYLSLKVWMPPQMRADLQTWADSLGVSLSHHLREVLVSEMFGRAYLPERQALTQPPEDFEAVDAQHERDLKSWREDQDAAPDPDAGADTAKR